MKNRKTLAVLAGTALLLNGVMITVDLPKISTVAIAEEEPPIDEDIPDAKQLKLVKDAKSAIEYLEELKADNDKDAVEQTLIDEAPALNGILNIKDEYKAQRSALLKRYNAVRVWAGQAPIPDPSAPAEVEEEKEFTETQGIDFKEVKKDDPNIDQGKEVEQTPGEKGELTITYKAKFKDGKEVAGTRTEVKREETKKPVDRVVLVGTRPTEKEVTETEDIDFKEIKENDPTLDEGTEVEKTPGKKGVATVTYKVKYKDGKEISREEVSRIITLDPVNRVVLVGTKKVEAEVEKEFTETQDIDFKEVKKDDATLEEGKEVEETPGKKGVLTITYKAKFKGETEVPGTREEVKREETTKPVDRVVRVGTKKTETPAVEEEREFTETQDIDFKEVKKDDATLEEGKEVEETPGKKGVLTITYKAKFKDGVEVPGTRQEVKREETTKPVDKVVRVGTKKTETPAVEEEKEFTETQDIDFKEVKKDDATLEKGKEVEETPGTKGVLTITYKAKFKDGVEVPGTRQVVKQEETTKPVDRVVRVGTKEEVPTPAEDAKLAQAKAEAIKVIEETARAKEAEINKDAKLTEAEKAEAIKVVKEAEAKAKSEISAAKTEKEVDSAKVKGIKAIVGEQTPDPDPQKPRSEDNTSKVDGKGTLPTTSATENNGVIAGFFGFVVAGLLALFTRRKN